MMSLGKLIKVFNLWRHLPYNHYVDIAVLEAFDIEDEPYLIGRVPGSRVLICREDLTVARWLETASVSINGRPSLLTLWENLS